MTSSNDSSQSTRPTGKNYSSFLDFTRNYKRTSGIFVPHGPTLDVLQDILEPVHESSNNVGCATSKASDQPAHMRSLIRAFASRLSILWLLSY